MKSQKPRQRKVLPARLRALFLLLVVAAGIATTASFLFQKHAAAAWYNASWNYRKTITIDHTKVTADQTNFPVLINLSSDTDLSANAQTSGNDILFTSSDGTTKLSHEIEGYTSGTGALVAWVKVPALSSTVDTVIYLYYGNGGAANQQDPTNVWDANYKAVWHLQQDPSGTAPQLVDSTANGANLTTSGTWTSAQQVAGEVGGSINNLFANNDYASDTLGTSWSGNFTVAQWVKWSALTANRASFASDNTGNATAQTMQLDIPTSTSGCANMFEFRYNDSTGAGNTVCFGASSTSTWVYLTVTFDGTNIVTYQNGTQANTLAPTNFPAGIFDAYVLGVNRNPLNLHYMDGNIDETEISNTARSASWVQTKYNNESSPSTFYSLGTVQNYNSAPAAPTLSAPSSGATGVSVTPQFQLRTTDAQNDYLRYKITLYQSDCTTPVAGAPASLDQTASQTGWSGQDQQTGTAYTGSSTITSSTIATYTYQGTLANSTTYCWKAAAIDPGGSNTWSTDSATQSFTTAAPANAVPAAPTLSVPANGATGQILKPQFQLRTTDANGDYLKYKILVCSDSACNSILHTIDQTAAQTGWTGQDQQTGTAYTGSSTLASSTTAIYTYQFSDLAANQTYYWQGFAVDPGGSNTWSSFSGTSTFTTSGFSARIL